MILSTSVGMVVRTAVSEISVVGRATQGVTLMSLREGDRVVSVAHVVTEEEPDGDNTDSPNDGGESPDAPPIEDDGGESPSDDTPEPTES